MTGGPIRSRRRATRAALVTALGLAAAVPATAAAAPNAYKQKNLVSDQPGQATITDPNLVNAWGLAAGPTTPLWVADNGTDLATVYGGAVGGAPPSIVPLVVKIPGGAPTGQVFNGSSAFGGAAFIFSSEAGRITAWTGGARRSPRSSATRRDLQGPRDLRAPALRLGLPPPSRRRVRREVPSRQAPGLHRQEAPQELRAVRDPGHRVADLRLLRQAGRQGRGRRRPGPAAGSSMCSAPRASSCTG